MCYYLDTILQLAQDLEMATATVPECIQDQSSPAAAPVQQTTQRKPSLKEGHIQSCQGYVQRRSKILKRYKKEWLDIIPGMLNYIGGLFNAWQHKLTITVYMCNTLYIHHA